MGGIAWLAEVAKVWRKRLDIHPRPQADGTARCRSMLQD
jgi:hypothetical protein